MAANAHTDYALRKTGKQPITPIHPEFAGVLDDILAPTYGLIVYQEQVQQIARRVASYSLGAADLLRKAMGKKKPEVLAKEYEPFSSAMRTNGYSDGAIKALWDILVPFSGYAFNKSHTVAYGMIAYWTAYMKANHPVEYMAALLESVKTDRDKLAQYLGECRRMGIDVLPPDINASAATFTAVGDDIRFGLAAVRNVGDNVVAGIVAAREEHGPATSFYGFLDTAPVVVCNKRVVESLIKAGAFDSLGCSRRALMEIYEPAIDAVVPLKRNAERGQDDLFGVPGAGGPVARPVAVPDIPEWEKATKLAFEREMLGLYVSDHPLRGLEGMLASQRSVRIDQLQGCVDGEQASVTICGMVTQVQRKQTKAGAVWAVIQVEDLDAAVTVMVYPKVYEQCATQLAPDAVVRIKGRLTPKDDGLELAASDVGFPEVVADERDGPVVIQLPTARCTPPVVDGLKAVLAAHPGVSEVQLRLVSPGRATVFRLDEGLRVTASGPLMADLKALLGPSCIR